MLNPFESRRLIKDNPDEPAPITRILSPSFAPERRRLTIVGSMIYDHPADFREMLDHIPESISEIVGAKFTLDDAQMAFEGASEVPGKSWISLDDKGAHS